MSWRKQANGKVDTSAIHIVPDSLTPLPLGDDLLAQMTAEISHEVIQHVPGFRYWEMDSIRKMSKPVNKCGYQQRAFDFYWSIREGLLRGRMFLGIGTSNCHSPGTFGTDKYCGSHPTYDQNNYMFPHMRLDADEIPYPFFDNKFGGVMANHVIEHLADPPACIREWYRLLMPKGVICIITPDMAFNNRGELDSTHTNEYSADDFFAMLEGLELPHSTIESFNSFDNDFSFEVVIRKEAV